MGNQYLAIIQARVGSTRLPEKVLMELAGKTVLEHVIERVSKSEKINKVIVATSDKTGDDKIEELCRKLNITCYRGSENDVLDRFYQAAKEFSYPNIIRITGDCPMIDPEIIDQTIELYEEEKLDYATNVIPPTFPKGLDVEIFTFESLEKAWREVASGPEREHVTVYFWRHPEIFKQKHLVNKINISAKRWVLDYEVDYKFLQEVFNNLYAAKPDFRLKDVLEFLKANPDLEKINERIDRKIELDNSLK